MDASQHAFEVGLTACWRYPSGAIAAMQVLLTIRYSKKDEVYFSWEADEGGGKVEAPQLTQPLSEYPGSYRRRRRALKSFQRDAFPIANLLA